MKYTLEEAIRKAKDIKQSGGVKLDRIELSNSEQDPLIKSLLKTKELLKRL